MRLTSTGLGIGTSSPSSKLDLVGIMQWQATAGTVLGKLTYSGGEPVVLANTGLGLRFFTNNTQAAVIDSSGNLGLGVTPSAWNSSSKALQTSFGAFYQHNTAEVGIVANSFRAASGFTYQTSSFAGIFRFTSGEWQWFNAPSGTAGNTVTYTQAMTLDASGNLGIGTTSPGARLGVSDGSTALLQIAPSGGVTLISSRNSANSTYVSAISDATQHIWKVAGTEAARIDSSGRLLVGTTAGGLGNTNSMAFQPADGYSIFNHSGTATGTKYFYFGYNGTDIGSVTQSGTTAVLYNVTSDQR